MSTQSTPRNVSDTYHPPTEVETVVVISSLRRAVRNAPPHTKIVLAPGTYVENAPIVISQPGLTICASHEAVEEGRCGAYICSSFEFESPFFRITANSVTISDLEIHYNEARLQSCILIAEQSDARIDKCIISCPAGTGIVFSGDSRAHISQSTVKNCMTGIYAHENSTPTVERSAIFDCRDSCVRVFERGAGLFSENLLRGGGEACICAHGEASSTFRNNQLGPTQGCGIMIFDRSKACFDENEISGHHGNGIQAGDDAEPVVKNNKILGSQGTGIVLYGRARGLFVRNEVAQSQLACVAIRDEAEPFFSKNIMRDGCGSGLVLLEASSGIFDGNQMLGNAFAGIGLQDRAHGLFDHNVINNNQGYGVWVQDASTGTFQHNEISSNINAGVSVGNSAAPCMLENIIRDAPHIGIMLRDQATGEYKNNSIVNNKVTNILLRNTSCGTFVGNLVADSPGGGIVCRDSSAGAFSKNRFLENGRANIAVFESSRPCITDNIIIGSGFWITGNARGLLRRNWIRCQGLAGVRISGHAEPIMENNVIGESGVAGIVLEESASGSISQNVVCSSLDATVNLSLWWNDVSGGNLLPDRTGSDDSSSGSSGSSTCPKAKSKWRFLRSRGKSSKEKKEGGGGIVEGKGTKSRISDNLIHNASENAPGVQFSIPRLISAIGSVQGMSQDAVVFIKTPEDKGARIIGTPSPIRKKNMRQQLEEGTWQDTHQGKLFERSVIGGEAQAGG
eukprot:CAMPEP_0181293678 /NCGR_PEP_ID=MMETSP1101-20121128/3191_1 /TAXON_ID=46948 /ORGANISM="Rhodomonas abbreviata, Strain Caron Lab Isolate" /LENGTH=736 /DNA_ID=CAMNT_0023398277 /DNA_START=102 /DNA_END=2312 /DNA_ORIENTATION=-